jgi:hypothetical protein
LVVFHTFAHGGVGDHGSGGSEVIIGDVITPESDVTDDFDQVLNFFIFGSFFLDKDDSLFVVERFVSHGTRVHAIGGLHSGEEAWSFFTDGSKFERVRLCTKLIVFSGLVWSHSRLPFGFGVTVGAPCDPLHFLSFLDFQFLFGLKNNFESSFGDSRDSWDISILGVDLSGDLWDHDWGTWKSFAKLDVGKFRTGFSDTGFNPRSIFELVKTSLDDHV